MSRLTEVIKQVKENTQAWIYDKNGNIADNVICGDVLEWLYELMDYEINVSDSFIEGFKHSKGIDNIYTYNYNACVSKDISIWYKVNCPVAIICIHLYGDARAHFSEDFAVRMEGDAMYELLNLESVTQSKPINDHLVADIDIFEETYAVYDTEKQEEVGYYYESEVEDLFKLLEEEAVVC